MRLIMFLMRVMCLAGKQLEMDRVKVRTGENLSKSSLRMNRPLTANSNWTFFSCASLHQLEFSGLSSLLSRGLSLVSCRNALAESTLLCLF